MKWLDLETGLFEEINNVVREKSGGGYNNDFVIGSPQLNDDGSPSHDNRMFFDKSKGAFRVGCVRGTNWDSGNIGDFSHAEGLETRATQTAAHAEGSNTTASGHYSHAEGNFATATANYAHAEGELTTASGDGSHAEGKNTVAAEIASRAGGVYASAYLYGQTARASGRFSSTGDAQTSSITVRYITTTAAQQTLFLDGISKKVVIPPQRTWGFSVMIVARQPTGGGAGDSAIYKIEGGVKRDGANNTSLVGAITKTVIAEDQAAWDATVEADDAGEALAVKVTGEVDKTIHWVARIDLAEVG